MARGAFFFTDYPMANKSDLRVVYRDPAELIPYARNARTHSPEQIAKLAASIKEFGFTTPVELDGENGILSGHGRVLAAQKLGLKRIPTIDLSGLTEAQRRAYILAANRLALDAGWDEELLAIELSDLSGLDVDLSVTGFTDEEIEEALQSDGLAADDEDAADEIPEADPAETAKTKRGDVWICGGHRVMCGDSTSAADIDLLMGGGHADLLLTDPPYGVSIVKGAGKIGGDKPFGSKAERGVVSGKAPRPIKFKGTTRGEYDGAMVAATEYFPIIGDESTETARKSYEAAKAVTDEQIIFGGNYFTDFLPPSRCWIAWDKGMPDGTPFAQIELAWVSKDANARLFHRLWAGLCREGSREVEGVKRVHPTQKPVSLMEDCLGMFPNAKVVLDLFGGSGSTLLACERQGRECRMMEMAEHYCDVIVQRWQKLTGKQAVRESDGQLFDEI